MSKENLVGKKLKSFSMIGILGAGSYAVVYQAIDDKTDSRVAVKAIPIRLIKEKPKLKQLVQTQIKVLKSCKNQNVIKHIDSFKSDKNVFIATEFCNGGDVQNYLTKKGRLPEDQATQFLKQILNGFKGLHEVNAMHRDFKLANLLLHNGVIKIADLGFAKQMEKQQSLTKTQLGTSLTMAPQVLDGMPYGMNADIWSLGVVYYQMLYGKYPYNGHTDFQIRKKIKNSILMFPNDIKVSPFAKDFIKKCLTQNPNLRISWSQIYDHPLIVNKTGLIFTTSVSTIKLQQNKDYYKKNKNEADKQFIYPEKQPFITQGYEIKEMEAGEEKQQSNYEKLKFQNEAKKKKEKQVFEYEQVLLKKRNNIMFMFRFFIPKIAPYLHKISACHNIALFIICKETLIQMQSFINELNQKKQKKNQSSCLRNFFESDSCVKLLNLLLQDMENITQQCIVYMQDVQFSSPQVQSQMADITKWNNQHWQLTLHEVLNQYWHEIAQNIQKAQNSQIVIQVLKALQFYNTTDQVSVEVFEKMLETLDYEDCKEQIDRKLFSVFQ